MIKSKYWLLIFILMTPLYADDDVQIEKKYVKFANGDSYYGDYEGRKRNGDGVYLWSNGDSYKGEFLEGKLDGNGIYTWSNGDFYKGEYVDNKRDGEGSYFWTNGKRFKGDFAEGKRDEGKLTTLNYKPNFPKIEITITSRGRPAPDRPTPKNIIETYELAAKHEAKKVVTESNNIEENTDDAKNINEAEQLAESNVELMDSNSEDDIDDGFGDVEEDTSTLADNDNLEDDTENEAKSDNVLASVITYHKKLNKPSVPTQIDIPDTDPEIISANDNKTTNSDLAGIVKVVWQNGDSYDGDYINGERTGQGRYIWVNGDHYSGDFVNGKRHGVGIYKWINGDIYVGEYMNDQRTGEGLYIWGSGDRYQGDFNLGFRHGNGTLKWFDGELYGGDFLDGKRTGKGIYVSSGGDRYEGNFEDGKRTGKGFLVSATGSLTRLEFEENPYLLQELEFSGGKLISATAEEEDMELDEE